MNESKLLDYKIDSNQLRHRMQRLDLENKIRSVGAGSGTGGYLPNAQASKLSQYGMPKMATQSTHGVEFIHTDDANDECFEEIMSG